MGKIRLCLLIALTIAMAVVMVLTWGSIGSILMGFCLVMEGIAILFHRFVIEHHTDDFLEDQNG